VFNVSLRLVLPLSLFGVICAIAMPVDAAGCPPGSVQTGEQTEETPTAIIVHPVCEWQEHKATGAEAAARFCAAKRRVDADERALQQMNFANDAQNFEMFAEVSAEQKAAFRKKVVDALLDQALSVTTFAADSMKPLNPYNVNAAIKKLRGSSLGHDEIFAALRKIAATKDKPAMAAAYRDFVELVQSAKEGYDAGNEIRNDRDDAVPLVLLGALKVAQGNYEAGGVVTLLDMGESFAYLGYVGTQVGDLSQITDSKLEQLNDRIGRLKQDVRQLNAAKDVWAKTRDTTGEPDCHR